MTIYFVSECYGTESCLSHNSGKNPFYFPLDTAERTTGGNEIKTQALSCFSRLADARHFQHLTHSELHRLSSGK